MSAVQTHFTTLNCTVQQSEDKTWRNNTPQRVVSVSEDLLKKNSVYTDSKTQLKYKYAQHIQIRIHSFIFMC